MTSSDAMKLRALYAEIDRCLERGVTSGPELDHLYDAVFRLVPPDEEIWANVDPRGRSRLTAA